MQKQKELAIFYFFELWEKLIRTKIYINSPEIRQKRRNDAIYYQFLNMIEHVICYIDETVVKNLLNEETEDLYDSVFIPLIKGSELFRYIHSFLDVFTVDKGNFAIFEFINKVHLDTLSITSRKAWMSKFPAIALSDNYSYSEIDLWSMFSKKIKQEGLRNLPVQPGRSVITIPIIDSDAPLAWPLMLHEIGHLLIENFEILVDGFIVNSKDCFLTSNKSERQEYFSLVSELSADFIALSLIGPTYYFSLASHAVLLQNINPIEEVKKLSHPPVSVRLSLLLDLINSKKILSPSIFEKEFGIDIFSYYSRLTETNAEIDKDKDPKRRKLSEDHDEMFIGSLTKFLDADWKKNIYSVLEKAYIPFPVNVNNENLEIILSNFRQGRPICSLPINDWNQIQKDQYKVALDRIKTKDDLEKLYPQREQPISVSSLLFAGWLDKILTNKSYFLEQVIKEKKTIRGEISEEFQEKINIRDLLIQRSINSSYLFQQYIRADVNG